MLSHGPGQCVFNRDDGRADQSLFDPIKNFSRAGAGNDRAAREHLLRSFMTEGTEFTLNGNFHE
jgi:hypothetical protein